MRKIVRAEQSDQRRDEEVRGLEQAVEQKEEENRRLQGQLALSQNAEQIESLKARQLLIHYANEIDRLRADNDALRKFKTHTSAELLALISKLRQEKTLQQNMSAQLEGLTLQLKELRAQPAV